MAKKIGKGKKAKAEFKVIQSAPQALETRLLLQSALQHKESGNIQKAVQLCRQVLVEDPNNPDAYTLLGLLARQAGRYDEAITLFHHILQSNPHDAGAYFNLGHAHKEKGDFGNAVICFGKCIALDSDFALAQISLANLLRSHFYYPNEAIRPFYEQTLLACFEKDFIDFQDLADAVLDLLLTQEAKVSITAFLDEGDVEYIFTDQQLSQLLSHPLFLLLLKRTVNRNPFLEKFLTKARKISLLHLSSGNRPESLPGHIRTFIFYLAQQCFWNEYVFYESPEEKEAINLLISAIADGPAKSAGSPLLIAMLGCYVPLYSFKEAIASAETFGDQNFGELIQIQVSNPDTERRLMPTIGKLSDISDKTSQAVRQQYEENPYPRWISIYRPQASSFLSSLQRAIHPNRLAPSIPVKDKPDVLVAGCGTGYHPISLSQIYAGANILAVDLSLASLAYAKRKALELGIRNITFLQADILDLHRLNKEFDVIECIGVLHHMEKPVEGLHAITSLLKSRGLMKIGLYSDYARRAQAERKEFIKKFNYPSSPDGIREYRRYIMESPDGSNERSALVSHDFYTTSSVRDLLFHSQECSFTLPEIAKVLEELKLSFLGFDIEGPVKQDYLSRFPDDPRAISLFNWDRYEQEHQNTFAKMYNFWVYRDL